MALQPRVRLRRPLRPLQRVLQSGRELRAIDSTPSDLRASTECAGHVPPPAVLSGERAARARRRRGGARPRRRRVAGAAGAGPETLAAGRRAQGTGQGARQVVARGHRRAQARPRAQAQRRHVLLCALFVFYICFYSIISIFIYFYIYIILNYLIYRLDQYTQEQKKELIDCCPTRVFEFGSYYTLREHANPSSAVIVARPGDCIFCRECVYLGEDLRATPEDALAVEVKHSNNKFTFTVETTGSLYAREVVRDALSILALKIKTINDEVHKVFDNI